MKLHGHSRSLGLACPHILRLLGVRGLPLRLPAGQETRFRMGGVPTRSGSHFADAVSLFCKSRIGPSIYRRPGLVSRCTLAWRERRGGHIGPPPHRPREGRRSHVHEIRWASCHAPPGGDSGAQGGRTEAQPHWRISHFHFMMMRFYPYSFGSERDIVARSQESRDPPVRLRREMAHCAPRQTRRSHFRPRAFPKNWLTIGLKFHFLYVRIKLQFL